MLTPNNIYAYKYEQHNFNKNAVSTIGVCGTAPQQTRHKKTCKDHAIEGYYIETSKEHYKCYKIWVKSMRSI